MRRQKAPIRSFSLLSNPGRNGSAARPGFQISLIGGPIGRARAPPTPNVLVPELRIGSINWRIISMHSGIEVDTSPPWLRMNSEAPEKCGVHPRSPSKTERHDRAAAEITRHQSRIENCVTKTSDPTALRRQPISAWSLGRRAGNVCRDRPRATCRFAPAPSRSEFRLAQAFPAWAMAASINSSSVMLPR